MAASQLNGEVDSTYTPTKDGGPAKFIIAKDGMGRQTVHECGRETPLCQGNEDDCFAYMNHYDLWY